jgi:hypothetical protein
MPIRTRIKRRDYERSEPNQNEDPHTRDDILLSAWPPQFRTTVQSDRNELATAIHASCEVL